MQLFDGHHVKWLHTRFDAPSPVRLFNHCTGEYSTIAAKAVTECTISIANPRPGYTGTAEWTDKAACSPKDNFCKEKGRKVSMARAMKGLRVEKDVRTKLWAAYFDRFPKGAAP